MGSIYDYLYVDRNKITSLYAQLFGGHLVSFERLSETSAQSDANLAAKIPGVIEGGGKESKTSKESVKEILDPHDAATSDVLSKLVEIAQEKDSQVIILPKGRLTFLDRNLLKIFFNSFEFLDFIPLPKHQKKEVKQIKKMANTIQKFITDAPVLPAFVFKSNDGKIYGGTLKEEFLSEPIISYYFKHQNKWLENISIIAIKENATTTNVFEEDHLTNVVSTYLDVISRIIFPDETIKISPVAILRKI